MTESKKLAEARAIVGKGFARLAGATAKLPKNVLDEFMAAADDATVMDLARKYVPIEVLKVVDHSVQVAREYPETMIEPTEIQFLRQLVGMALRSAQATASRSKQTPEEEGDAR